MSQLDKIIKLFPEGGPAEPVPEVIAKICVIDNAIHATREDLEHILNELEGANRASWELGNNLSWNHYDGTPFARFPEHKEGSFSDLESLAEIHRERYVAVAQIFADQNVRIEDGGIKTFLRSKKKLDRRREAGRGDHCPDLSRVRLVVPGLAGMEDTYDRLSRHMPWRQVGNFNYYSLNIGKKYPTPFRGVLTNWCGLDEKNANDQIATEVQLVTERVRSIMDLDHPFNVAQVLEYPDEEARDYVYGLMLKASILDFKERFAA